MQHEDSVLRTPIEWAVHNLNARNGDQQRTEKKSLREDDDPRTISKDFPLFFAGPAVPCVQVVQQLPPFESAWKHCVAED